VDQALSRAEKLGGSRIPDPGVPRAEGRRARRALRATDDDMKTDGFRDHAGNVFGVFSY
jgi:hypothetical protein